MTGKQLDNEFYDKKIKDLINKNSDKPYLEGFKNWAKPRRSRRTIYNYLLYVLHFLNYINKDIGEIELDDYARYADAQSNLSSSNQIAKYSAIKCFSKYLMILWKVLNVLNSLKHKKQKRNEQKNASQLSRCTRCLETLKLE